MKSRKQVSLTDPCFNGMVNGRVSRRALAAALLEGRTVFPSPLRKWISKAQNIILMGLMILLTALSTYSIAEWVIRERVREITLKEIYTTNERAVLENKAKAFEKYQIAGAGDNTPQGGRNAKR